MHRSLRLATLAAVLPLLGGCAASETKPTPEVAPRPNGYPQPIHLVPLLTLNNKHLTETADLIARTANARELQAASARLVKMAEYVGSDEWRAAFRPWIQQQMAAGAQVSQRQIDLRLDDTQGRFLVRIYDAMAQLFEAEAAEEPPEGIIEHCKEVLEGDDRRDAQRRLAAGLLVKAGEIEARQPETPGGGYPGGPMVGGTTPTQFGPVRQAPRVLQGQVLDVAQVTGSLNQYFVVCYQRELARQGRFGAWITLYATVNPQGSIAQVQGRAEASVPVTMVRCLEDVMRQAQFAPPRSGTATFELALTFTPNS